MKGENFKSHAIVSSTNKMKIKIGKNLNQLWCRLHKIQVRKMRGKQNVAGESNASSRTCRFRFRRRREESTRSSNEMKDGSYTSGSQSNKMKNVTDSVKFNKLQKGINSFPLNMFSESEKVN